VKLPGEYEGDDDLEDGTAIASGPQWSSASTS
jgi:hypothetical protein